MQGPHPYTQNPSRQANSEIRNQTSIFQQVATLRGLNGIFLKQWYKEFYQVLNQLF